jgi:enoyl-CoA hydratase/carnithine racemase
MNLELLPIEGVPRLESAGRVATLTLVRPTQRNSLTDEDLHTLLAHFEVLQQDLDIDVVVLRADTRNQPQPVFSSGYHVAGFDDDPLAPLRFERIVQAFENLRPITVCALNGSVYGGATDLVLASDLIVAQQGLHWRMPALALGLHYYPSGLQRYVSRLGLNFTKRAFLLGQAIAYEDLCDTGVFESLVPAEAFEDALQNVVKKLSQMAPLASQNTKKSLNEIAAGLLDQQRLQARSEASAWGQEFAEGRQAFAQRRAPNFQNP